MADDIRIQTLEGRMIFAEWHVTNIVTNVILPYRPNLRALVEFVGDVTSWAPGLFPGLKLLTWLKPRHLCQCKRRKKNKSCECNCRALVFDTGKMIITGCETISQVHQANTLLQQFFIENRDLLEDRVELPDRKDRFQARHLRAINFVELIQPNANKDNLLDVQPVALERLLTFVPELTDETINLDTSLDVKSMFRKANAHNLLLLCDIYPTIAVQLVQEGIVKPSATTD
jgi:hypothetical protein